MSNARLATVTGVNPYQVQLLGESAPLNIAPVVLSTINVGDYVWCEFFDQQLVVIGPVQDGSLPQLGSTEDLNNYVYTGRWNQPLSANATTANHYPTTFAGMLEVFRATSSGGMVHQRYSLYNATLVFWRTLYNGTWNPWTATQHGLTTGTTDSNGNMFINHSLGVAPVTVIAQAAGNNGWVAKPHGTVGATNFAVHVINAAASGASLTNTSVTIDWMASC